MTFKDLTGDPVFDFVKAGLDPKVTLIGAWIQEKWRAGPKEPRKVIHFLVQDEIGKKSRWALNYLKVTRHLQQQGGSNE